MCNNISLVFHAQLEMLWLHLIPFCFTSLLAMLMSPCTKMGNSPQL